MRGKNPRKSFAQLFQEKTEFYKNDVNNNTNGQYEFIEFFYKKAKNGRNEGFIKVKHLLCGDIFDRRAIEWRRNKNCFCCAQHRQVSFLHSLFCIVAESIYQDAIKEYHAGFFGPNGGQSKYDLYIPNYNGNKTLFEFQSRFHDGNSEHDSMKAKFALDNGYTFYAIDARRTEASDAVAKFFGEEYVTEDAIKLAIRYKPDFDYGYCQALLDKNLTISKISEIMGVSPHKISHRIRDGRLSLREDRKQVLYKTEPVIQLTPRGDFVSEYKSSYQVLKQKGWMVSSCLSGVSRHSHGYVFIRKSDYESGNYTLPITLKINEEREFK